MVALAPALVMVDRSRLDLGDVFDVMERAVATLAGEDEIGTVVAAPTFAARR